MDKSGDVSLSEFTDYVKSHEKKLKLVFKDIDRNQDGKLDTTELMNAFRELGVKLTEDEAKSMIRRSVHAHTPCLKNSFSLLLLLLLSFLQFILDFV